MTKEEILHGRSVVPNDTEYYKNNVYGIKFGNSIKLGQSHSQYVGHKDMCRDIGPFKWHKECTLKKYHSGPHVVTGASGHEILYSWGILSSSTTTIVSTSSTTPRKKEVVCTCPDLIKGHWHGCPFMLDRLHKKGEK